MDKYVGKRLDGRYEIRELIGVGGMAFVYKAYDSIDDRIVAVKILKDEYLTNEEFTRRFKNESKAIAILSHPNIVKVYDVSFGDRMQYIVMEYIDGITLKEYIERQNDIKWKEAVHFTIQILRALQHAHDKGIVHRDIKPQNIMLLADGTIKVTDFGIARFARHDIRITGEADKVIGSVHYISPEQARGAITDEKADIYSVGVMMYEMLTGSLPFEADNAVSVAIMQMQADPRPLREINTEIPDGLEEITLKAMQKDPAFRYQSAAEMLYDIDEFKRNPSIHFEYKYDKTGSFVDEDPTLVGTITNIRSIEEPATQEEEEEQEEEIKGPPVIPILAAVAGALALITILFVGAVVLIKIVSGDGADNITMDDFRGMNINEVLANEDYKAKYIFDEENFQRVSSDTVAKDVIISQNPPHGISVKIKTRITFKISSGPQQVAVPGYNSNEPLEDVLNRIRSAGLEPQEIPQASDEVAEGKVIKLSPDKGSMVDSGSTVAVFVSSGSDPVELVEVPSVVQTTSVSAAVALLQKQMLIVNESDIEIVSVNNTTLFPKGAIVDQSPKAGEKVAPGTAVKLKVSSGFVDVNMPLVLPTNYDQPVDIGIYVESVMDSQSMNNILLTDYRVKTLTFSKQQDSYIVTIRIKPSSSSQWQTLERYEINGKTGEKKLLESNSFDPPQNNTTDSPTTSRTAATTSTTGSTSTTDPANPGETIDD